MNERRFRLIVVGIMEDSFHNILLIRRAKPPAQNLWALPGGGVYFGENSTNAVIREIKEEVGLDFTPKYSFNFDDFYSIDEYHSLVICSFGDYSGNITPSKNEVVDFRFFTINEIERSSEIAFCHKDLVHQYLSILELNPYLQLNRINNQLILPLSFVVKHWAQ